MLNSENKKNYFKILFLLYSFYSFPFIFSILIGGSSTSLITTNIFSPRNIAEISMFFILCFFIFINLKNLKKILQNPQLKPFIYISLVYLISTSWSQYQLFTLFRSSEFIILSLTGLLVYTRIYEHLKELKVNNSLIYQIETYLFHLININLIHVFLHKFAFNEVVFGYNFLRDSDLINKADQISNDAIELSMAPNCPNCKVDALIAPDQMILQIHESIGHPLELDRILGDERNYAGSSFVSLDMFGKYKYGSDKLNISFNPSQESELATYNYDDDGTVASKRHLIKDGILQRPIGGFYSSQRADQDHVACSRATSWNRPPIDRMGNINLEPGESSFSEMIASVEDGILLETNNSWSIDDYRNKFQFGCEKGTVIKNGELKSVTKNPNYRGITKEFWHNLSMVGDETSFSILGTANCGKGEPNQTIFVGHATPPCLFREIDIFGGE